MRLTPLDIRKQEFRKGMRGLDADEVYAFLSTIADEYEAVLNENKALRERVLELDDKVQEYRNMEKTLRDTLLTAERVTVEAKDNARREADLLIKEAQIEAAKGVRNIKTEASRLREQIQNLRRQRDSYLARVKMLAESHMKFIESAEEDFVDEEHKLDADRRHWDEQDARARERESHVEEVDLPAHRSASLTGDDKLAGAQRAPRPAPRDPLHTPLPPGPERAKPKETGDTRAKADPGANPAGIDSSEPPADRRGLNEMLEKVMDRQHRTREADGTAAEPALSANTAVDTEDVFEEYEEIDEYTPRAVADGGPLPAAPRPDPAKSPSEWSLDRLKRDILSTPTRDDDTD